MQIRQRMRAQQQHSSGQRRLCALAAVAAALLAHTNAGQSVLRAALAGKHVAGASLLCSGIAVLAAISVLLMLASSWLQARDAERVGEANQQLSQRQAQLLAADDSVAAYLLSLEARARGDALNDDSLSSLNRRRRPSALADAIATQSTTSTTLEYLQSRRFTPNAALVGALSASPGTAAYDSPSARSPTRSVDEFESPRRLLHDDADASPLGFRGFDRFHVRSRVVDSAPTTSATLANDGSPLALALASRFGAAYSAAPLDAQARRASKLAGVLGIYGEDDPDSDDDNDDHSGAARATDGSAGVDGDAGGDADLLPSRRKLSLRQEVAAAGGDEYRASVDRALNRLGFALALAVCRERMRQWLAAAIFKPLAALMLREEQGPLVATAAAATAAAATPAKSTSLFGTPFGKPASAAATPASANKSTSWFGGSASKPTTPGTPSTTAKTPPRRFGSTESLFGSPRPTEAAAAATTTTSLFGGSASKPAAAGAFSFGSAATTPKSLFPTSFPTSTSAASSIFGVAGPRGADEVAKEPRELLKSYFRVLGCTSPDYVAHRMRELARGTCLSDYRWNGGGTWNGKAWTSDLPTDAQIVLHAFCTYMDALLPAQSSARAAAFSDNHVVAAPITRAKITSSIMLFQAQLHPPHVDVLFKKYLVPLARGATNLFDALCVFLHCVQRERDGFIGIVSLADPGVRLMDVVSLSA
jgi:hypothetical protein